MRLLSFPFNHRHKLDLEHIVCSFCFSLALSLFLFHQILIDIYCATEILTRKSATSVVVVVAVNLLILSLFLSVATVSERAGFSIFKTLVIAIAF